MDSAIHPSNPFEMLIDPQAILLAVENSNCLRSLKSKICRPLDQAPKPSTEEPVKMEDADVEAGNSGTAWSV